MTDLNERLEKGGGGGGVETQVPEGNHRPTPSQHPFLHLSQAEWCIDEAHCPSPLGNLFSGHVNSSKLRGVRRKYKMSSRLNPS